MNDHEPTLADVQGHLDLADPEGFLHDIYHTLEEVYRVNSDRHDEEAGDDKTTFGTLVYRNSWAILEQVIPRYHPDVQIDRPKNSLEIRTPSRRLKVYRGGSDKEFCFETYDPINGSITQRQLIRLNELERHQLSLFEQQTRTKGLDARLNLPCWFILHDGNPEEGLLDVRIGAPLPSTSTNVAWSFILPLPDLCAVRGCRPGNMDGVSIEPNPPFNQVGPSYNQLVEPQVLIKPNIKHAD